ncbi:hypothetical protein [Rhizobium sp. 18055]|uniref:hypothetical protein n=1 Tax=Rhizobium sp. 18055 TaxID=2681403 RepID=UPI00135A3DF7|nr:hypothetical protein [Rhizobium sp. 18055]
MIAELFKPSNYVIRLRKSFREIVRPGRALTELEVARLAAEINTAHAIAIDFEHDMIILENTITPVRPEPVPSSSSGVVIPIRRRPVLRLVVNDGGDAA